MTLTLIALLLFLGVIGVIIPLTQGIRFRLSPKFANLTKRTRNTISLLVLFSLLYELSFLVVYLNNLLVKFPSLLANTYWVSAGIVGIIFGFVGINCTPRLIRVVSLLQMILGFDLLCILVLAIGITSM